MNNIRPELGDFCSIVCLKSIIEGVENTFGKSAANIILATVGRARGKKLAEDMHWTGHPTPNIEELQNRVRLALGETGTRLFILDKLEKVGQYGYRVLARETVCSAGEPLGSIRQCTYTMAVIGGVLSAITGLELAERQVASVLNGSEHDIFEYVYLLGINLPAESV